MKHHLHVIFLLELVDQHRHLGGVIFRQLGWQVEDVLALGSQRGEAALLPAWAAGGPGFGGCNQFRAVER